MTFVASDIPPSPQLFLDLLFDPSKFVASRYYTVFGLSKK